MKKYPLNGFYNHLFDWVESFKTDDGDGKFSLIREKKKPSLYGICDIVFNLFIPNKIDNYLNCHENDTKKGWIEEIQSYQNPKTGWFKDNYFNYKFRSPLTGQWQHATAFAVSALKLLGASPKYRFQFSKKLDTRKKVEKWLRKVPEWGLFFWPGSHRGGGIGAILATMGEDYYPHDDFFQWYFDWLDKKADPKVGFWRLGWNHKLKKGLTKHELGGAIHYYWIYEFMGRPIPFPKRVIDSTLKLQNDHGLWDDDVPYCIDLDAMFALLRCQSLVKEYRREDIDQAIIKFLDYTIPCLNDEEFLFDRYVSTHKLTGSLGAIAEIYKFIPELFDPSIKFIQSLDISPWI
ncbi:MAG: hypothetical protein EU531_08275 [Promethearchaeota archaeon]|nr:MAG: hypothetical protein EU531_08275 [Candidatus Lokiarchaeota archaeon]